MIIMGVLIQTSHEVKHFDEYLKKSFEIKKGKYKRDPLPIKLHQNDIKIIEFIYISSFGKV